MQCVSLFRAAADQRVAIYADAPFSAKHYRAVIRMLELELSWAEEDEAAAIEARRAETQGGSVHESAVGETETPERSIPSPERNRT